MTAAMLTFAGTLLVAVIGAVIARLDANDRHQKLSQKVDILAKLPHDSPAHARMSGIVVDAIDELGEYEHRRRSAVFQRRALTMAFLAWLVVVGLRIAAEQSTWAITSRSCTTPRSPSSCWALCSCSPRRWRPSATSATATRNLRRELSARCPRHRARPLRSTEPRWVRPNARQT
ncbi:hypothetical protein [Gordonia sp. NPDC058843]|uniref:hypothetical protein n=1 Tax=Gordonia sp. NPDC058843 TaxID=3346648 RepID=UPI0036B5DFD1